MRLNFRPWIGVALFIAVWYIVSWLRIIPHVFFDPPHRVFPVFLKLLTTQRTWCDILATFCRTLVGFLLAALAGIPIGLCIGYSSEARGMLESITDFLRSIPATALLPLFIVTLGLGDSSKVALVAFSSALIVVVYTMLGVQASNKARQQYAATVGASRAAILVRVVFPDALPSIFAGLRVSVSLALVLMIVAEMLMTSGKTGLGGRVYLARYGADYTEMYALIVVCGLIGFGLNRGFQAIGDRFIHWKGT